MFGIGKWPASRHDTWCHDDALLQDTMDGLRRRRPLPFCQQFKFTSPHETRGRHGTAKGVNVGESVTLRVEMIEVPTDCEDHDPCARRDHGERCRMLTEMRKKRSV